jgi:serine/threonine-protein kinase TNNI3K
VYTYTSHYEWQESAFCSTKPKNIMNIQLPLGDATLQLIYLTYPIHVLFDRYRGTYSGYDVCIKILRITHFNSPSEVEFLQQALILRQAFCHHYWIISHILLWLTKDIFSYRRVNHENILKFYGTCTVHPQCFGIVTGTVNTGLKLNLTQLLLTSITVL